MTTTTTPPAAPVRFTESERLLALEVAYLADQLSTLRTALGAALKAIGGPACQQALTMLYPEDITDRDGTVLARNCQAPADPVPPFWLRDMASGRSLAQVAGGRARAEEILQRLAPGATEGTR